MSLPTISLCMIVKNEENFIDTCLEKLNHLVDEIIVVDTGSSDTTIEICERYGAKVYSFVWDNHFAKARNFGIEKATKEWIFYIDADEELENLGWEELKNTLFNTVANIVKVPVLNYVGNTFSVENREYFLAYQPRLFKNHIGIKFQNRIHETLLVPNNIDIHEIESSSIKLHHYGYLENIVTSKNKSKRNMQLLAKELANPTHSPWIEYHIASEFYQNNDYESAIEYMNYAILKFIEQGMKPPALLYKLKYNTLLNANKIEDAYPNIEKAILLYPDYVDLHFYKGIILYEKQEYEKALQVFQTCLQLGEGHTQYLILGGVGSFKAAQYKAMCLEKLAQN